MGEHTKGPWRVIPYSTRRIEIVAPWSKQVPTDSPRMGSHLGIHVCQLETGYTADSAGRTYADANLIAAAPNLLGACEKLIEAEGLFRSVYDDDNRELALGKAYDALHEAYDMAEAAIAKARGETTNE